MWAVIKYKKDEYNILSKTIKEKLGEVTKFYNPKLIYYKIFKNKKRKIESNLLGNYVFCYFEGFKDKKTISKINNVKGLEYVLEGYNCYQTQITKFINLCKDNENENGGIKQSFFSDSEFKKIKFLSGPFSNLIFDVVERKKDKIKLSLGGIKTTINMDSENLFSPVF